MANPNSASVAAIQAAAAKYGLDPNAMVAVARVESGLNPRAIGDGGHAFGLFQFNNAGGVATGDPNPQKYLDPNYNAMEAARHIASIKGAKQARGAAAVKLIVNQFERPANKSGEISKALSFLGNAAPQPSLMSKGRVTPSNGSLSSGNGNQQVENGTILQTLLSTAMAGSIPGHDPGESDPSGTLLPTLLQASQENLAPAPTINPPATQGGPPVYTSTGTGTVTTLKNPKIIGTPYKGTHTLGNWESDDAVDIAMPVGTPLYAVADGTIGSQIGSLGASSGRFAGQRLHLKTSGNELYYAHLSKLAVKAGQQVKKGQLLGYSGEANGVAHLHLGSKNGDPQKYA